MVINVDEQGKKSIESLCDVALKTGGLSNLKAVGVILDAVSMIEEPKTGTQADEQ